MGCLFCEIINGKIPCYKVYEDADVFAFLDINPTMPGHTLVLPKKHCSGLLDVDVETLSKIMTAAQKITAAIQKALGSSGFNIIQNNGVPAGQVIEHLHFHIIPRNESDGLKHWPGKPYSGDMAADIANKIQQKLEIGNW
ncbi:HIT family protein [Candidatus Falkowbacteria bacterium]|nr:HIT family protein [Candidatus Falkowbacteria bacterium]